MLDINELIKENLDWASFVRWYMYEKFLTIIKEYKNQLEFYPDTGILFTFNPKEKNLNIRKSRFIYFLLENVGCEDSFFQMILKTKQEDVININLKLIDELYKLTNILYDFFSKNKNLLNNLHTDNKKPYIYYFDLLDKYFNNKLNIKEEQELFKIYDKEATIYFLNKKNYIDYYFEFLRNFYKNLKIIKKSKKIIFYNFDYKEDIWYKVYKLFNKYNIELFWLNIFTKYLIDFNKIKSNLNIKKSFIFFNNDFVYNNNKFYFIYNKLITFDIFYNLEENIDNIFQNNFFYNDSDKKSLIKLFNLKEKNIWTKDKIIEVYKIYKKIKLNNSTNNYLFKKYYLWYFISYVKFLWFIKYKLFKEDIIEILPIIFFDTETKNFILFDYEFADLEKDKIDEFYKSQFLKLNKYYNLFFKDLNLNEYIRNTNENNKVKKNKKYLIDKINFKQYIDFIF